MTTISENATDPAAAEAPREVATDDLPDRRLPLRKTHWLDLVASLDPVADAERIHRITVGYEFPWDYQRALELALYRTYCTPGVSDLLYETGEFRDRPQKRYDDTALLMVEIVEHGYRSERGVEALRVINRQHGRYDIHNDEMLYVLSTFIFEPIDWIDQHGWRRLHPNERIAAFTYYREVGRRMGIKDIPETPAEFRTWRDAYERRNFACTETTRAIGNYTRDLMCSWYPAPLRPLVRAAVYCLIDEPMRRSFDYPHVPELARKAVFGLLHARSAVLKVLPPRKVSRTTTATQNRTYPGYPTGYRPSDLGACPIHAGPKAA